MRQSIGYLVVAAASILLTVGFSSMAKQQSSLDPVVVAPEYFETALENEFVRVLKVTVKDGIETDRHAHLHRVVAFVTDCTWRNTARDGSVVEEYHRAGEVFWKESEIHDQFVDRVNETCELLEIELK